MIRYVAGLFDGEGSPCIIFQRKKDTYLGFVAAPVVQIVVGHADEVFLWLKENFGGYICTRTKVPYWRLYQRDDCRNFVKAVLPRLIVRKEHCVLFLNILKKMDQGIQYTRDGLLWIAKEAEKLTHNTHRRKWTYKKILDVMSKNKRLRLKAPRSKRAVLWTMEEDKFLRENWKNLSDKNLSLKMNRSRYGVKMRRQRLRLLHGRPFVY